MLIGFSQCIGSGLAIFLLSTAVFACTCVDYGVPSCKLFGDADAVFVGKVERITAANDDKTNISLRGVNSMSDRGVGLLSVHFEVQNALKGVTGATATALTYAGTSCDLDVKEGQTWLIFANKDGKTGLLGFGACVGNRQIEMDDSEFKEFEQLSSRSSSPIIRGRISLNQYDGVKGAQVSLNGQGTNLKTQSDEDGSFVFHVQKEGRYSVRFSIPFSASMLFSTPTLPPRFKAEEPTEMESSFSYDAVARFGTCDYQYFDAFKIDLKATASISGKFIHTDWKSFREFYPDLCRMKPTEKETLESCSSLYGELKPDGSFSFDGLREGRYTITVGDDLPNGPEPFYRHYYPGVREFSKAQVIEIRQGELRRGLRFILPPMLPTRRVRGQIFTSEGKPAILANDDGRYFYLAAYVSQEGKEPQLFFQHSYRNEWKEGSAGQEVEMITSKADGSFDLELFDGFTYFIKAESGQPFNGSDCGFAKIDVNGNLKQPVRVVLDHVRPCSVTKIANKPD